MSPRAWICCARRSEARFVLLLIGAPRWVSSPFLHEEVLAILLRALGERDVRARVSRNNPWLNIPLQNLGAALNQPVPQMLRGVHINSYVFEGVRFYNLDFSPWRRPPRSRAAARLYVGSFFSPPRLPLPTYIRP